MPASRILQLKVTLKGVRPAIWRRVEVSTDATLLDVHGVLQAAMGWTDSHLHQFDHDGTRYGVPDREFGEDIVSERRARVGELLRAVGDRLVYEYDFGDGWEHVIVLEATVEGDPALKYPRVPAGKRACPPEDVGGPPGFDMFLAAVRDPKNREHKNMREWIGGEFDSEVFDVIAANDRVPKRRRVLRADA
jgi:hypothetical protein